MKLPFDLLAGWLLLVSADSALAVVHYVDANSTNATVPYVSWATAARNIQDAVDAAIAGDEIVVTNGVYATGERVLLDYAWTRVVVDKPLALRSVNGPAFTLIDGGKWVRCLYLTNDASLSGFTLTNGYAGYGGGVLGGILSNCTLSGNSAFFSGGGAKSATLKNCTLSNNSAVVAGGGAHDCTLTNCTVTGNSATGGWSDGEVEQMVAGSGGAACDSILTSCVLTGNSASDGGGACRCVLFNCTLTGNHDGGAVGSTLNNCIIYFNDGGNCGSSCTLKYCCTTPLPTDGVDNISLDPQLASASHLSANSPCRAAGAAAYASGTDIDGEGWAALPSIGCDEYEVGAVTGLLSAAISARFTNVAVGFAVPFSAMIEGRTTGSWWDFGDGVSVTNHPHISHAWMKAGDYDLVLRAFNESHRGGISATAIVHVAMQPVHYVAASNTNPVAPYLSWGAAATNIQDALDAAAPGGLVLVTNGTYTAGLTIYPQHAVRSVSGSQFTVISATTSGRCVYLASDASLSGFTLRGGGSSEVGGGGGVLCESSTAVVSNCVIAGNTAAYGGGAYGGTLYNCTLVGNVSRAPYNEHLTRGGGACGSTLNNCIVVSNWCSAARSYSYAFCYGCGAANCTLNNCTVAGNFADPTPALHLGLWGAAGADSSILNNCILFSNSFSGTLNHCCTFPGPADGIGNITHAPLFVDPAAGNFRLQPISPCINAGNNAYVAGNTDLDGNPRINRGTVDIGAYEFQANIRCVDLNSTNPTPPYTYWSTAATNIQDAVDAAAAGDEIVVTNGVYGTGGRSLDGITTNRVSVDKPLTLRSASGPQFTVIDGGGSNRCVSLTNGASLSGFTLTNGRAAAGGGGVSCESTNAVVSNCVLSGNSSFVQYDFLFNPPCCEPSTAGASAGGAYGGTLNNCILNNNRAETSFAMGPTCDVINCAIVHGLGFKPYQIPGLGGGARNAILNNCTVTSNSAGYGGGAYGCLLNNCTLAFNLASAGDFVDFDCGGGAYACTANNCIAYFNTTVKGTNYDSSSTINYSGTTPLPTHGVGNITNAPLFVDPVGGNFRLQPISPCINAGNNFRVVGASDLDGNPRINRGTVDIGAYEFQNPASQISYAWLQQFNLPITPSTDDADPDADGMNNWQEWRCGTDPTNALSVLRLLAPVAAGTDVTVSWPSVAGVNYFLERSASMATPPSFTPVATNIPGQPGTTSYTDTNAAAGGPFFYRLGVGD